MHSLIVTSMVNQPPLPPTQISHDITHIQKYEKDEGGKAEQETY